jgi:N-acetylmuramoyl-L-alanine amidase
MLRSSTASGAIFATRSLLFWGLLWALPLKAFDTVVLDPGHGGHDRGAAIGYVFEKHLALDTARRVEELLKKLFLDMIKLQLVQCRILSKQQECHEIWF